MYDIYGIAGCRFCAAAIELCQREGVPHRYWHVADDEKQSFLDSAGFTGRDRTFPRVWEGERVVGGYSELEAEVLFSGVQETDPVVQSVMWDDDIIGGPEDFS